MTPAPDYMALALRLIREQARIDLEQARQRELLQLALDALSVADMDTVKEAVNKATP